VHIPDGFIDLPTSAAFAAASAVAVAGAVKGARRQLSEQSAPLAGLTAALPNSFLQQTSLLPSSLRPLKTP